MERLGARQCVCMYVCVCELKGDLVWRKDASRTLSKSLKGI